MAEENWEDRPLAWAADINYIHADGSFEPIGSTARHPALVCVTAAIEAKIEVDARLRDDEYPAYDLTIIRTRT